MIAQYYENRGDAYKAGVFYAHQTLKQYAKAITLLSQSSNEIAIEKAIEVVCFLFMYLTYWKVGKAKNEEITNQVLSYLWGDTDGIPKDLNYIYRLHLNLENWEKAAKTAVLIARQEQELGICL